MKITIAGTGYIGLVTGACFAETGHCVTCVDIDKKRIEELKLGKIPIHEPGLDELVARNTGKGRLLFDSSLEQHINNTDALFIAVGTPSMTSGKTDISSIEAVAETIGKTMRHPLLVIVKSTVPVGTSRTVRSIISGELRKRGSACSFEIASNPEFLREGCAVDDFMKPDRIIAGTDTDKSRDMLKTIYKPFTENGTPLICMDIPSAEMSKYASNAMLASRISFMNEIANLCDAVGADVRMVKRGMAADERIGHHFLNPGCGYGGSCFPKDVQSLIQTGLQNGVDMKIAQATEQVNTTQRDILFEKLARQWGSPSRIQGKTIAIWGTAFKPDTDDTREAPSIALIHRLLEFGAHIRTFDPIVRNISRFFPKNAPITETRSPDDAATGADALLLVTEWDTFQNPDWKNIRRLMRGKTVLDGRNIYNPAELKKEGFSYRGIGIPF